MLKRLAKKAALKSAQKDMEPFLGFLRSGTDDEMAMMLCATGFACQFLRTSDVFSRLFPEGVFLGEIAVDNEVSADLSRYILEINVVRKTMNASGDRRQEFTSSGLGVFVQTFRALQYPELFALGRALWGELQRGSEGFADAVRGINPDFSESDIGSLRPTPNMLAPD